MTSTPHTHIHSVGSKHEQIASNRTSEPKEKQTKIQEQHMEECEPLQNP